MSICRVKLNTERKYYKYVDTSFTPPTLTAATNGSMGGDSFGVLASATYGTNYAWQVFNAADTGWASTTIPCTLDIYNPNSLNITNIHVQNSTNANYGIKTGYISVSDDGTNWEQITTYSNSVNTAKGIWDISLSGNTSYYKYYRLGVSTQLTSFIGIGELTLTATERTITESTSSDYDFYEDVPVYKAVLSSGNYYALEV